MEHRLIIRIVIGRAAVNSAANVFSTIIFVQWGGVVVVTFITKLLGIQVYVLYILFLCSSFFQMFSSLGYSMIPLFPYALLLLFLPKFSWLPCLLGVLPVCWCLRSNFSVLLSYRC